MDRDYELATVMADVTRYRIYRWVAGWSGADVTVAEAAEEFGLHPNVARMHLAQLEQAGCLVTSFRRSSGGGRPAKLYRLSDMVKTFGFPPRRYELLSRLALDALTAGGSLDDALRVCREAGAVDGRRALAGDSEPPRDGRAAAAAIAAVAEEQGLMPEVDWDGHTLRVVVHNCSFRELSGADSDLVCAMHRAFLGGLLEVVTTRLGESHIDQGVRRISRGDHCCEMRCTFAAADA